MPRLTLPYPSSSLTETHPTGNPKFGWCEASVDIPECAPSDFKLAVTRLYNLDTCSACFERDGAFWYNAFSPIASRGIQFDGFRAEIELPEDTSPSNAWLRNLGADVLIERLDARAAEAKPRIRRDQGQRPVIGSRLRAGDGHGEDLRHFEEWAADNLVWADGRLMKRVHSPSGVVGWRFHDSSLDNNSEPIRAISHWNTFGRHDFRAGLHFRLNDPAFEETWIEVQEWSKRKNPSFETAYERQYAKAARQIIGDGPESDHIRIHDNIVVDSRVLERISEDGWEDMVLRSATSLARSMVKRSPPHLHAPGQMRIALEELKALVTIGPDDRGDDFAERMDEALAKVPENGNRSRQWFIDAILSRWEGREVALAPSRPDIRPKR